MAVPDKDRWRIHAGIWIPGDIMSRDGDNHYFDSREEAEAWLADAEETWAVFTMGYVWQFVYLYPPGGHPPAGRGEQLRGQ